MKRKTLYIFFLLISFLGYSQNYQVFRENRTTFLKRVCTNPRNLPPGQSYISAPQIYIGTDHDYLEIKSYPGVLNRPPIKVYYGLENMLCGVTLNPARRLVNTCYEDLLNSFTIKPTSMNINLTTPTSSLTNDNSTGDEVTLTGTTGYHELVYNWQVYISSEIAGVLENQGDNRCGFNFGGKLIGDKAEPIKKGKQQGWINLPNKFLGKEKISFTAEDLFGNNAAKVVGKSLKFRIGMSNGWNSWQILPFTFIASSPKLKKIVKQNLRCNYTKDATFKLELDRNLVKNEKLIVSVFFEDVTNKTDGYSLFKQEDSDDLIKESNGNYSFTWQGLNEGFLEPNKKYKVKYQTQKNGVTNADLATLKFSPPFIILLPKNVNFKATKLNDETCFNLVDGKIRLNITSGEETRKYSYILYKVEDTKETVYRNWTEFSGKSTIIENLDKNKYKIKVKDSNECFAR